jgi:hypothetical protein
MAKELDTIITNKLSYLNTPEIKLARAILKQAVVDGDKDYLTTKSRGLSLYLSILNIDEDIFITTARRVLNVQV